MQQVFHKVQELQEDEVMILISIYLPFEINIAEDGLVTIKSNCRDVVYSSNAI